MGGRAAGTVRGVEQVLERPLLLGRL